MFDTKLCMQCFQSLNCWTCMFNQLKLSYILVAQSQPQYTSSRSHIKKYKNTINYTILDLTGLSIFIKEKLPAGLKPRSTMWKVQHLKHSLSHRCSISDVLYIKLCVTALMWLVVQFLLHTSIPCEFDIPFHISNHSLETEVNTNAKLYTSLFWYFYT